jgi:hypothetical protein
MRQLDERVCAAASEGEELETAEKFQDAIISRMEPEDIAEAKKRTSEWTPGRMPSPGLIAGATPESLSGISSTGDVHYVVGNGVKPPEVLEKPLPLYTEEARKARYTSI